MLDGLLRMAPPMTVGLGEPASAPLRVDTALGGALSGSTHAEIRLRWALLLIKHEQLGGELDLATFEAGVLPFLREQGNQKYILPAYTALVQGSAAARTLALQSFKASAHLHALVSPHRLFERRDEYWLSTEGLYDGYWFVGLVPCLQI